MRWWEQEAVVTRASPNEDGEGVVPNTSCILQTRPATRWGEEGEEAIGRKFVISSSVRYGWMEGYLLLFRLMDAME